MIIFPSSCIAVTDADNNEYGVESIVESINIFASPFTPKLLSNVPGCAFIIKDEESKMQRRKVFSNGVLIILIFKYLWIAGAFDLPKISNFWWCLHLLFRQPVPIISGKEESISRCFVPKHDKTSSVVVIRA